MTERNPLKPPDIRALIHHISRHVDQEKLASLRFRNHPSDYDSVASLVVEIWERLPVSEATVAVLERAVRLVHTSEDECVEPMHLLSASTVEGTSIARMLKGSGADLKGIQKNVEDKSARVNKIHGSVPSFSPDTLRVINSAVNEAERLGSETLEPRHVILGIVLNEACDAAQILKASGADFEKLKKILTGAFHSRRKTSLHKIIAQNNKI